MCRRSYARSVVAKSQNTGAGAVGDRGQPRSRWLCIANAWVELATAHLVSPRRYVAEFPIKSDVESRANCRLKACAHRRCIRRAGGGKPRGRRLGHRFRQRDRAYYGYHIRSRGRVGSKWPPRDKGYSYGRGELKSPTELYSFW